MYRSQADSAEKRFYPLVTELAADGIPVAVSCRGLTLSCQPYYRWLQGPITTSEVMEAYRANALFDAHRDDPQFGHRLLAHEARKPGPPVHDDPCAVVDQPVRSPEPALTRRHHRGPDR